MRSTTFLFITWCTSIQIFGVLGVQIGAQCHKVGPADAAPRRRASCTRPHVCRAHLGVRAPSRLPKAARLPEAARAPRPLKSARATWSPRPRRHLRTALPTGPSPLPLRGRAARVCSPYCGVMAGTLHDEGLEAPPSRHRLFKGPPPPCPRVARRRWSTMPAARASSVSARPAGRSALPAPRLGPKRAQGPVHCPAPPFSSPGCRPQRAPLARATESPHRRGSRQLPATKSGPVELVVIPRHFPGQERPRTRRSPATRAAGRPRGPNCESPNLPRGFHAKRGPTCKKTETSKVPGAKINFNSVYKLLKLVKCVENHRKFRKLQNQFFWICCEEYYNFCYSHMV
jgi:hypothetical protein